MWTRRSGLASTCNRRPAHLSEDDSTSGGYGALGLVKDARQDLLAWSFWLPDAMQSRDACQMTQSGCQRAGLAGTQGLATPSPTQLSGSQGPGGLGALVGPDLPQTWSSYARRVFRAAAWFNLPQQGCPSLRRPGRLPPQMPAV